MLRVIAGFLFPAIPFALTDPVSAAIIAGVFSLINTLLNLHIIRLAKATQDATEKTKQDFQKVKETAVESREELKNLVMPWDGKNERRKENK